MEINKSKLPLIKDLTIFLKYLSYIRYVLTPVIFLMVLSFALSLTILFIPGLEKLLFDKLFITMDSHLLIKFLGISIFLLIYDVILSFLFKLFEVNIQYRLSNKLKLDFTQKLFKSKYNFFLNTDSGTLVKRVVEDSDEIALSIIDIFNIIYDMFSLVLVGTILFFIGKWLFILYSILILLSCIWAILWTIPSLKYSAKIGRGYSALYTLYWEILPGIKAIKINNLYKSIFQKLDTVHYTLKKSFLIHTSICSILWQISHIFPWVGFAVILVTGLEKVEQGEFTIGIFYALISMLWVIFSPLQEIFKNFGHIHAGIVASKRTELIQNASIEPTGKTPFENISNSIIFRNISFSYENSKPILKGFNLTIKKGSNIALVGETGCGKSTIAHLLVKLFNTYTGNIIIDNNNLQDLQTNSIRQKIGYVQQEPYLFNSSVRSNIDLNNILTDESINTLLEIVNLKKTFSILPKGLDTVVGENGTNFSIGEQQRICIARSLAMNPEILILDEITASLDSENEYKILTSIFNFMRNKTIISISHRQSNIKQCDKIFVLKKGTIVEHGTYEELIKQNGEYCRLFLEN